MGWSGGSILFNEVIDTIQDSVIDPAIRKQIYKKLIAAFEDIGDCDTLGECYGNDYVFDDVWNELYGDEE